MRIIGPLLLTIGLLCGSHAATCQPADSDLATSAQAAIAPWVAADQFSGVVLVARRGRLVPAKNFLVRSPFA